MFARIVHSDWSKHPGGRWYASACRTLSGWRAEGPWPVGGVGAFVGGLVAFGKAGPTLAAFDFPIGLPEGYGARTGFPDFRTALDAFGGPGWEHWFDVAAGPSQIGPRRPFYPFDKGGTTKQHLLDGLDVSSIAELMRQCDLCKPPAGCMFWTLGAQQVGKAAIHGWTEAIRPALKNGGKLWPFDGDLGALATGGGLVLAESYPADACRQLDLVVKGKGNPIVLQGLAGPISRWAVQHKITLADALQQDIDTGFVKHGKRCGDAFDAVIGLLAAIAVADGRHPDGAPCTRSVLTWEGWILGRHAPDGIPPRGGALGAGGVT